MMRQSNNPTTTMQNTWPGGNTAPTCVNTFADVSRLVSKGRLAYQRPRKYKAH